MDGYIERQRSRLPTVESVGSGLISVLGSYLGEAIITSTGGKWDEHPEFGLFVLFPNGDGCFPFKKVVKQIEGGLETGESILSFYNISVDLVAKGGLNKP